VKISPAIPEKFLDETKALACIHCGLCLGSCPTYLETGDENESPRGRIYLMRAMQEGRLALEDRAVGHIDSCLGCRACEAVCPSGVEYGNLLEHTRDHIEKKHRRSLFETFLRRVAIEKVFPFPGRMKLALTPARLIRAAGLEKFLPARARSALSLVPQDAPAIPLPKFSAAIGDKRGRVGFITGCVMSVLFGKTNAASVRLLNRAGYDVIAPRGQVCCGALYAHGGRLEMARESARRNIECFERENLDAIIINAAGCGSTLKQYGHLLAEDTRWAARAKEFSAKVKDLTEWIPPVQRAWRPGGGGAKVTYHDACHLAHAQRITGPPRALVKAAAGENFIELPEADLCCGSAGTYNLTEPEMAQRLQARKVENILRSGAQIVVTSNPGCILQIQAGLRQAGSQAQVMHIAEFLETER
jgi:glycolate oxidase iron-sulfur subunit